MSAPQVQLKISLSEQLNSLLLVRAKKLGIPVTQYVKYVILKEVEEKEQPTFQMSEKLEKTAKRALKEYKEGKSILIKDLDELDRLV